MSIRLMIGAAFAVFATALAIAQTRTAQSGGPLPGITPVEFEEFRIGLDDFLEVEASEEGLGPAFNGTSCAVCHNVPVVGGVSPVAEMRAGRVNDQGEFETLDGTGETLFHLFSVPGHACQPIVPAEANVFARRVPIPVFGAGLVEAIPDDTLRDLEDPFDRNGDGVSGRAAIVVDLATGDRRVGRFGWKAQHATLLAFSADAYRNEMGITNDLFPTEIGVRCGRRSHASLRSVRRSRGHRRSADAPPRHRQLRELHEISRAPRARGRDAANAGRRKSVPVARLRDVSRARPDDGRERESALQPEAGGALL